MERRDFLRAAAAAAALSLVPHEAEAQAARAWATLAAPASPDLPVAPLSEAHRAIIRTVADAIIPRTDSPGANDVNVLGWIEVIAQDYYTDAERTALTTGLDAMDALSRQLTQQPLAGLAGAPLAQVMDALDAPTDRTTPAARGYSRLKGLVIHGYFTSERVQKDVLKTQIMPGRFNGAADMPTKGAGRDE
ncbi:MAG: gluconate 2-dehydrogenase subunit 3 family protein [Gemmatimonadaceae bacterium]|nr:gluconate 2-dehydrogenase subunit 3 family protein [Gemmatimonadaceae bacterium]